MIRSILVGLDGSEYSASAIELGIEWAQRLDCLLVGLGIIDVDAIRGGEAVPIGAGYYKEHGDEVKVAHERRQVEGYLDRFARRCAEASVACKLLEDVGPPVAEFSLEAQRYDLVILGQQTYFESAEKGDAGEVLRPLLKNAPRPIVTVPKQLTTGRSVVVAYDGSLQAARVLQAFQNTILYGDDVVHVVTVASDRLLAARIANRAIDFLGFHQVKTQSHPIASSESPASVILDMAQRLDARLLVMGAYGQPTLREFLLGSVTRTVLKESQLPLFLYH
jgi:nucleotide-binding universal stress UspA family protein